MKNRLLYIKKETIEESEHKFLLIHHFKIDPENPIYFKSKREFLYGNKPNIFSAFGFIDDTFKIDSSDNKKFFFLLEYPEHSCYFYFSQEINPIYAPDDSYIGMHLEKQTCQATVTFDGLTFHEGSNHTFLDGVNKTEYRVWFYAIGQRTPWEGKPQIPGFTDDMKTVIREVCLYIQIEDLSLLSKFHSFYSCQQTRRFNIIPFLFIFICFS